MDLRKMPPFIVVVEDIAKRVRFPGMKLRPFRWGALGFGMLTAHCDGTKLFVTADVFGGDGNHTLPLCQELATVFQSDYQLTQQTLCDGGIVLEFTIAVRS